MSDSVVNTSLLDDEGHLVPLYQKYGHWIIDSEEAVGAILMLGVFDNVVLGQLTLRDNPDGTMTMTLPDWFWEIIPPQVVLRKLEELKSKLPASLFENLRFD